MTVRDCLKLQCSLSYSLVGGSLLDGLLVGNTLVDLPVAVSMVSHQEHEAE